MNDLDLNRILEDLEDEIASLDHIKFKVKRWYKLYENNEYINFGNAYTEIQRACTCIENAWGELEELNRKLKKEEEINEYE